MPKSRKRDRVRGLRLLPKVRVRRNSVNQSSREGSQPQIIVLHSTEGHNRKGVSDLEGLAAFFDNPDVEASSHVATDADGWSSRMVPDNRKAWTVGNLNRISLNIEQIGFAAQGRKSWRKNFKELRETARWIALWSRRHDIAIRKAVLTSSGGVVKSGVCTHDYASKHGAGSDHWDPGDYPMGFVLWLARGFKAAQAATRRPK